MLRLEFHVFFQVARSMFPPRSSIPSFASILWQLTGHRLACAPQGHALLVVTVLPSRHPRCPCIQCRSKPGNDRTAKLSGCSLPRRRRARVVHCWRLHYEHWSHIQCGGALRGEYRASVSITMVDGSPSICLCPDPADGALRVSCFCRRSAARRS
jgi:hypothetical protein